MKAARKKAKRAPAKRAKSSLTARVIDILEVQQAEIERQLDELQAQEKMDVSHLLALQMQMNVLQQMLSTATNVAAAMNASIAAALRNLK